MKTDMDSENEEPKTDVRPIDLTKKRSRQDQSTHEVCVQFSIGSFGFFVKDPRIMWKAKRTLPNKKIFDNPKEIKFPVPEDKVEEDISNLLKRTKI